MPFLLGKNLFCFHLAFHTFKAQTILLDLYYFLFKSSELAIEQGVHDLFSV